jgi:hypothetical protein
MKNLTPALISANDIEISANDIETQPLGGFEDDIPILLCCLVFGL